MKGSKSRADAPPKSLSRQRRYLALFLWVVIVCLSFGAYTLLVNTLVHGVAGQAHAPLGSLAVLDAETVIIIDPAIKVVGPGETFSVDVMIESVNDLGAFQFDLTYDPACVEATDVTLGPFLGSTGRSVGEVGPIFGTGIVTYGAYSLGDTPPGPDGDGVLATITFQAGMDECSSDLHLQNIAVTDTSGDPISNDAKDGEVIVGTETAPSVTSITPDWGYVGRERNVIVGGEKFQVDASVKLAKSGQSIFASQMEVQNSTHISCTLNLGKAETGQWDVVVTNPDDQSGTLANGFTVKERLIYLPVVLKNG
jgi:hypothetical protein